MDYTQAYQQGASGYQQQQEQQQQSYYYAGQFPQQAPPQQQQPQAQQVAHLPQQILPPPVQMDPSMQLSDQERNWALELKHAVQDTPDRFPPEDSRYILGDMELAHVAIVSRGNLVEGLVRLEGLQQYRREYELDHSPPQILEALQNFMHQQPGYLLHMDVSPVPPFDPLLIMDSSQVFPKVAVAAEDKWRVFCVGIYYTHYVLWPTLATVRHGLNITLECGACGWHNFSMEQVTRLFEEVMAYMPIKFKSMKGYNTNVVANLMFSMARPFMGPEMKKSVQLGCQVITGDTAENATLINNTHSSNASLAEFYLQPSLQAAELRILQKAQALLSVRKYNEQVFRLE